MRENAKQFQVILRSIADAITLQDATGQLIYANEAAARTIGYPSVQSLLQTPLADVMRRFEIMDGAGQPFPLARLPGRLALQGEPSPETILRFRVVDTGEERWSAVKTTPIFDERGEVRFAVSIFQDVTVRQQAERRLAMQLAVTRLLAEAATFDAAAPRILEAIGQGLGWEWGAVWRMDRHAGLLHCAEV
ncbi:MAG: PAS domain S-box protein [Chloroflexi bacterium]|nr:PAS domain S-box protein [Chloroflexota bacterium]